MSRRGKFITLEGLDGTGKSTQMRKLAAALRKDGHKVVETREPGGTATGEKIRKVLLDSCTAGLSPLAEMALMFASRAQHIAEVIEPGLAAGSIVLCDRFTDSTEAYQGSGRRLGSEPDLCTLLWACTKQLWIGSKEQLKSDAPGSASSRWEIQDWTGFAQIRDLTGCSDR